MMNEFTEVMVKHSDEELVNIVGVRPHDYTTLALEAANAELAKRNLDPKKYDEILTRETELYQIRMEKENRPLSGGVKALVFFVPVYLPAAFLYNARREGCLQQVSDIVVWRYSGVFFYIALVFAISKLI